MAKASKVEEINEKVREYAKFVEQVESQLNKKAATFSTEAFRLDGHDAMTEFREHLANTRHGRFSDEAKFRARTPFQIDRDRILYSSFFMPLALKTQMIIGQHASVLRNRLSHTLIVANIARSIAQGLGLNPDLTEAISLGHDLGHAPFGHAGERTLNAWLLRKLPQLSRQTSLGFSPTASELRDHFLLAESEQMENEGKKLELFQHGRQSIRKLEILEDTNLTKKTVFGIWRHSNDPALARTDAQFRYHFPLTGSELDGRRDSSYEAQVVRVADDIAWVIHGLDDAIRARILDYDAVVAHRIPLGDPDNPWTVTNVLLDHGPRFVGPWVRRFISGVVESNDKDSEHPLDKSRLNDPEYCLLFPTDFRETLARLRELLEGTVHDNGETLRAETSADRLLSSLGDCYWDSSADLISDVRLIAEYRGDVADQRDERKTGLNAVSARLETMRPWSRLDPTTGTAPDADDRGDIEKAALICDFLSALTDEEAVLLGEWHYSPRFRMPPAFVRPVVSSPPDGRSRH